MGDLDYSGENQQATTSLVDSVPGGTNRGDEATSATTGQKKR